MPPVEVETEKQERRPAPASQGIGRTGAAIILAAVVIIGLGAFWFFGMRNRVVMTTPYQAVLLSNGSAYFGRLEGLGTPFPVLRDVFYVQNVKDPQTSQVNNVLVKRGKEWHQPDRMILNGNMIVLVEPVNPESRVAQLISQAKNK